MNPNALQLLRERILNCGVPFMELARRTGVPYSTIRYIARGKTVSPRFDVVLKLWGYFEQLEREKPVGL